MKKSNDTVIISLAGELIRVLAERIVYIESDGNYSTMVLHDKLRHVFSFNLSHFTKILETQLKTNASRFIRVGKSIIINREYVYRVNPGKQQLILSDNRLNEAFVLTASKEALKDLKLLLEKEIAQ
jgi:DNA-binding LytR/AlgR family response regulator